MTYIMFALNKGRTLIVINLFKKMIMNVYAVCYCVLVEMILLSAGDKIEDVFR